MNIFLKTVGMGAVALLALLPAGFAGAQSYQPYTTATYQSHVQSNDAIYARIQALLAELQRLQLQLTAMQGGNMNIPPLPPQQSGGNQQCFPSGQGTLLCYTTGTPYYPDNGYYGTSNIESVEADLDDNSAEVRVEYRNGRDDEFLIGGVDSRDEVIEFLADELDISESALRSIIDWNGDFDDDNDEDVESIDVEIDEDNNDSEARVEYEDGDIDRFDYNTDDEDEIIEELADDLDMDEDDVEDLVDFDYNDDNNDEDVESIDVEIDESDIDAEARVEFEDGDVEYFYYDEDDEDEIIEELADDLDMDEDDVEDLVDFDYVN